MVGGDQDDEDGRQRRSDAVRDEEQDAPREAVDDGAADQEEDHQRRHSRRDEPCQLRRAVARRVEDQQRQRDQGDTVTELGHGLTRDEQSRFAMFRELDERNLFFTETTLECVTAP